MMNKNFDAYKTIGEVAKILSLNFKNTKPIPTHTIRFWEKEFRQIKPKILNGRRRYYDAHSIELLKKVEDLQNKKYEIIFKSRPDLFFYSNISLIIPDKTILFENTIGDWNRDRSDRFFYGKREIFFSFMEILEEYSKKAWSEKSMYPVLHQIPLQEQLMKYCSDKSKINTKPFLPIIRVWRPDKEPDMKNICKIFLYMVLRSVRIFFYGNKKSF